VNTDLGRVDIAIFSPFNRFKGISRIALKEKIPNLIKETYKDFYEISNDKLGYFFISGNLAQDISFINYLSRETRLPIQEVDVWVNFDFKKGELPPVTREESFIYGVALGAGLC